MVCSTLLRFTLRLDSVMLRESVRFRVTVTFLVCTIFLYTVLYCRREHGRKNKKNIKYIWVFLTLKYEEIHVISQFFFLFT